MVGDIGVLLYTVVSAFVCAPKVCAEQHGSSREWRRLGGTSSRAVSLGGLLWAASARWSSGGTRWIRLIPLALLRPWY